MVGIGGSSTTPPRYLHDFVFSMGDGLGGGVFLENNYRMRSIQTSRERVIREMDYRTI